MKSHARILVASAGAMLLTGCSTLGLEEDYIGGAPPASGQSAGPREARGGLPPDV